MTLFAPLGKWLSMSIAGPALAAAAAMVRCSDAWMDRAFPPASISSRRRSAISAICRRAPPKRCAAPTASSPRTRGSAPSCSRTSAPRRRCRPITTIASEAERAAIVARLGSEAIALVSDAGTPLISDPGYKLVRAARAAGHAVHTLPGPCAAIAALTLAGLPTDRFLFVGFLPAKAKARGDAIAEVAGVRATLVLYESGPRLGDTLGSARRPGSAPRDAAVVREISKLHEECVTGTLAELADRYADAPPKGEIVIVVGPPPAARSGSDEDLDAALDEALDAAVAVARRRRSRRAARRAQEARLRPRARTGSRVNRAACREARPRRRDARRLVAAPARLADPRPTRAGSRRRSRPRRPARPHARLRRGQGARAPTTPRPCRSTHIGCAGSPSPPSGSRRAILRDGDDIRIDAIFIVPRRLPRHLANIWHG